MLLSAAAFAFFACTPTTPEGGESQESKVVFTAKVQSVSDAGAEIEVSHDGTKTQAWAYVVTEDLETTAANLAKIACLDIKEADLKVGTKQVVAVDNLDAEKTYRFVVFGVSDDLKAEGKPGDVQFTTSAVLNVIFSAEVVSIEKNAVKVKVSYDREGTYNWFAFTTTDLDTPAASLINAKLRTLKEADVKEGKDVEMDLELDYLKTYRFIVSGYKDEEVFGTPAAIEFTTASKFTLNTSWDFSYYGKTFRSTLTSNGSGKWATLMAVTAVDKAFDYFTVDKSVVEEFGIDALIEEEYAALAADVAYYLENYGENYGWAYWVYTTEAIGKRYYMPYDGPGNYVTIIYGMDADNEYALSGDYFSFEFAPTAQGTSAAYEAWLGEWVTAGQVWTIEEKVPGETYKIYGVNDYSDVPFEGNFYNGKLYFNEQDSGVITVVNSSDGEDECVYAIWGKFDNNSSYWGGTRTIFVGTLDGDTAALAAQNINSTRGDFTGFEVMRESLDGEGAYYGNRVVYSVPNTMSRPSETASEGYSKWLGVYDVVGKNVAGTADSTYFNIKIKPNVNDINFQFAGWGGYLDYEDWLYGVMPYNAEDESVTIVTGDDPSVAWGVNINFGDNAASAVYMMGLIPYNTGYARITGSANAAVLSHNAEGGVVVTPGHFDNGSVAADYALLLLAQYHGTLADDKWTNTEFVEWICDAPFFEEMKIVRTGDLPADAASIVKKSLKFNSMKNYVDVKVPYRYQVSTGASQKAFSEATPAKAEAAL